MAKYDPQLEKGYFKIANQLFEAITLSLKNLSKTQIAIIFVVLRFTYGYSRKEAEISIGLFSKATGIDRRNISRELKSLLDLDLISRTKGRKMKYGQPVYKYMIIKKGYRKYYDSTIVNTTTEAIVNTTTIKNKKENFKKRKKSLVDKYSMRKIFD